MPWDGMEMGWGRYCMVVGVRETSQTRKGRFAENYDIEDRGLSVRNFVLAGTTRIWFWLAQSYMPNHHPCTTGIKIQRTLSGLNGNADHTVCCTCITNTCSADLYKNPYSICIAHTLSKLIVKHILAIILHISVELTSLSLKKGVKRRNITFLLQDLNHDFHCWNGYYQSNHVSWFPYSSPKCPRGTVPSKPSQAFQAHDRICPVTRYNILYPTLVIPGTPAKTKFRTDRPQSSIL